MNVSPKAVFAALRRAREPILWIGATYLAGVLAGGAMVHAHNDFALRSRDSLVSRAQQSDPAARALNGGSPLKASAADFAGNLILGAVPSTVMGLAVIMPFPLAAYRGWVGGVVSVDWRHVSRLADPHERLYYLIVLLLQLIPYTLAGGAGVRLGLASLFPRGKWGYATPQVWLRMPADGVRDVVRIYALIVPLFAIASFVEFMFR